MPIFEYRCRECGEIVEKIQREPQREIPCPACGRPALRSVSLTAAGSSGSAECSAPSGSGFK